MYRRQMLAAAALPLSAMVAGCIDTIRSSDDDGLETEFELLGATRDHSTEDPPSVVQNDDQIVVEGAIEFGSGSCSTVELVHAEYEWTQQRIDLLIAAVNDDEGIDAYDGCTMDSSNTSYRAVVSIEGLEDVRQVTATEHHKRGEYHSTTRRIY